MRECHWTIAKQYQILPKYRPIFRILMATNSKTRAKITTLNVPIPIAIKLLQFLLKKGQYIVPNNIVDQYAHVCVGVITKAHWSSSSVLLKIE